MLRLSGSKSLRPVGGGAGPKTRSSGELTGSPLKASSDSKLRETEGCGGEGAVRIEGAIRKFFGVLPH